MHVLNHLALVDVPEISGVDICTPTEGCLDVLQHVRGSDLVCQGEASGAAGEHDVDVAGFRLTSEVMVDDFD